MKWSYWDFDINFWVLFIVLIINLDVKLILNYSIIKAIMASLPDPYDHHRNIMMTQSTADDTNSYLDT
jgi:hypothetical protein